MTSRTKPAVGGASGRGVSFGPATTILAVPTGVALINPDLAAILASAELTLLLTALFAPDATSERAFRLLRWMTGRPEPTQTTKPAPTSRTHHRSAA